LIRSGLGPDRRCLCRCGGGQKLALLIGHNNGIDLAHCLGMNLLDVGVSLHAL